MIHHWSNLVSDRSLCRQAAFLSIDSTSCNNTLLWHWRNFRLSLIHHNIRISVQDRRQRDRPYWTVIKLVVLACRSLSHCGVVAAVDRWANMRYHGNKTIRKWYRATMSWLGAKEPCKIQSLGKWNVFVDLSSQDAEPTRKWSCTHNKHGRVKNHEIKLIFADYDIPRCKWCVLLLS